MFAKSTAKPASHREATHQPATPSRTFTPEPQDFGGTRFGSYRYSTSPLQFSPERNATRMPTTYSRVSGVSPIQMRSDVESMSGTDRSIVQAYRHSPPAEQVSAEGEPLQHTIASDAPAQQQAKPNKTGLPDNLKSGIENLSGVAMDNVKVHYNSTQPAQLNALAYAQGTDIHIAPGQERHLPHEAWHVVQQAQGRVRPTMQMKGGVAVNDDGGLEREADLMGGRVEMMSNGQYTVPAPRLSQTVVAQTRLPMRLRARKYVRDGRDIIQATIKTIGKATWKKVLNSHYRGKYARLISKAGSKLSLKKRCKRNLLIARFASADQKRRYNLFLKSAGMGKKGQQHPIGLNSRSAGHTEPQLSALLANTNFKDKLKTKLGVGWTLSGLFSSNQPCTSSGGGTDKGCSGMTCESMGKPQEYSTLDPTGTYKGGEGPTYQQVLKALGTVDPRSAKPDDESDDEALDEDDVRGHNMVDEKLKFTSLH